MATAITSEAAKVSVEVAAQTDEGQAGVILAYRAAFVVDDSVPWPERAVSLARHVRDALTPGMPAEVQAEVGMLLVLLHDLDDDLQEHALPQIEVALSAALCSPSNLVLAKAIRESLQQVVSRRISPLSFFRGKSPAARVILGMAVLLYLVIPAAMLLPSPDLYYDYYQQVLGIQIPLLFLVAGAGALGSIVSIMVRIKDFASVRSVGPAVLFFTGFFKPVVGASFALFVFAMLNSGLLPVTIDAEKATYFFAALAFVSGFSERFATDVATRAEKTVLLVKEAAS